MQLVPAPREQTFCPSRSSSAIHVPEPGTSTTARLAPTTSDRARHLFDACSTFRGRGAGTTSTSDNARRMPTWHLASAAEAGSGASLGVSAPNGRKNSRNLVEALGIEARWRDVGFDGSQYVPRENDGKKAAGTKRGKTMRSVSMGLDEIPWSIVVRRLSRAIRDLDKGNVKPAKALLEALLAAGHGRSGGG